MSLFLKYLPDTDLHAGVVYKWTYQWDLSLAAYKQLKSVPTDTKVDKILGQMK